MQTLTEPRITEGTLETSDGRILPLEWTRVEAVVAGPVATVTVRQCFRNPSEQTLQATYLFPLPHQASVFGMQFQLGERVVKAVVKEKEEARRAYQAARAAGKAATLLEQERPNLFTLSVANIAPGASIEVQLEYQDLVAFDDGLWCFVFPMVAGERYHAGQGKGEGGTEQVPDGRRIRPPRARQKTRVSPISLHLKLTGMPTMLAPHSPSHAVKVHEVEDGFEVSLGEDEVPNRDFVLEWLVPEEGLIPRIWFERQRDKPGTFCVALPGPQAPPLSSTVPPSGGKGMGCGNCGAPLTDKGVIEEIPGVGPAFQCPYCGVYHRLEPAREVAEKQGREVVFLLDRSASTRGLTVAARALTRALEMLGEHDVFKVVAFHHEFSRLSEQWLPSNEATRQRAQEFIAGLSCVGGTELEGALREAAADPCKERTRVVVLISDAAVGNEGRLLKELAKILAGARLMVLGVGPAANRYLIDKLAQRGKGVSDVAVGEDSTAVERFARRVGQAGPVLTQVSVSLTDSAAMDVYPQGQLQLFSGQSLTLTGRFVGSGPARLLITGMTPGGSVYRQELAVQLPEQANEAPGLERLWARRRIEDLSDQLIARPERLSEIRLEVLGLALKHSLMSPYTALVAEDSEQSVDPEAPSRTVEVELARPEERACDASKEAMAPPPGAGLLRGGGAARPAALPMPSPLAPSFAPPSSTPYPEPACLDSCEPDSCMEIMSEPEPCPAMERTPEALMDFDMPEFETGHPVAMRLDAVASSPAPAGRAMPQTTQKPVELPTGVEYTEEELARAREMVLGHLDLVFLIDETGSMGAYIAQVKAHLLALVAALRKSPLCRELRLGLVTFRDHPPQEHSFVTRVVPLTASIDEVAEGVQRMVAHGGGDGPEAVTDGLHDLMGLDWNPEAARLVVLVGDAPPHGVEPGGDGFPAGCPCGRHWYTQAESCREMGITVHTVGCSGITSYVGAVEVFETIARATGGLYVPLSQAALLVGLISGLALRELDRRRLANLIQEVVQSNKAALEEAVPEDAVRFVAETLQSQGVRVLDVRQPGNPAEFRAVNQADVALLLSQAQAG